MRRILSSTGTRQKFPKTTNVASPQLQRGPAPDTMGRSSSQTQSVPRSKTFARLLAFFSSPSASSDVDVPSINSKDSHIGPAEESQNPSSSNDQSRGKKHAEARCAPSLRTNDRLDPKASISQIEMSDRRHKVSTTPGKVGEAPGDNNQNTVYISDEDSSLSNIADILVKEQPLFTRESRSTSNTALSEENSEQTHNGDKRSVAIMGESPENASYRGHVTASSSHLERAVSPPPHEKKPLAAGAEQEVAPQNVGVLQQWKVSQNKLNGESARGESSKTFEQGVAHEKVPLGAVQAAVRKLEWIEKNSAHSAHSSTKESCPITADDNLSFTSAAEEFSSVREPEIKKDERSAKIPPEDVENEVQNSPQPSVESPTVESVTTSSSGNSRADRYCEHPGPLPSASEAYKIRGGDSNKLPDSRVHEISRSLRPCRSPILHYDIPPGVNAQDFLHGPVVSAVVEEGTEAQRNRRDSHAAFLRSEENPARDGKHAKGMNGSENKPAAGEGAEEARKGVRKTKSGLGQRIAATAKKLPRGASFPRLRSWGEQFAPDAKPAARSMSLSKHGKNEKGRSTGVREFTQNKELTGASEKKFMKETYKEEPGREGPQFESNGRGSNKATQECNRGPISHFKGSVKSRHGEGATFRSDTSEKRRVMPTPMGKKKPHEDMLCISKLAPENFVGDTEHEKKDMASRRPLLRPKTIARGVPDSRNKAVMSVHEAGQAASKLRSKATDNVMEKSEKALLLPTSKDAASSKVGALADCHGAETRDSVVELPSTKACREPSQDDFRSGAGVAQDGDMVTVERVIRRTKADGSSETVRKKIRLRAERVLPNGDVIVRRTLQRLKEDGSGSETVTISQLIPRRKKAGATRVGDDETTEGGQSGRVGISLPNLETAKEETEAEKDMWQGGVELDGMDRATSPPGEGGMDAGGSAGRPKDGKVGAGGWGRMWSFQGKEGSRKRFWRR